MDDIFWIEDAETLDVIADPVRMELLEQLAAPRTVKELADAMEVPRTRLYHHIGLLVDAGVIRVVESREKRALTERVYQASARAYQPSQEFLAGVDPRRQAQVILDSLFAATRADFVRSVEEGTVALDGPGTQVDVGRRRLMLTASQHESFLSELGELFGRYRGLEDEGATPIAALTVIYPSSRS